MNALRFLTLSVGYIVAGVAVAFLLVVLAPVVGRLHRHRRPAEPTSYLCGTGMRRFDVHDPDDLAELVRTGMILAERSEGPEARHRRHARRRHRPADLQ